MVQEQQPPIVKTTTEARQGVTGHNVRYVLAWGLALAVVMMVILYFTFLHSPTPA